MGIYNMFNPKQNNLGFFQNPNNRLSISTKNNEFNYHSQKTNPEFKQNFKSFYTDKKSTLNTQSSKSFQPSKTKTSHHSFYKDIEAPNYNVITNKYKNNSFATKSNINQSHIKKQTHPYKIPSLKPTYLNNINLYTSKNNNTTNQLNQTNQFNQTKQ